MTSVEVANYDYTDAAGELVFQVVRYDPKGFSQRRPDGRGGWIYDLDGVQKVPYRLPQVLGANTVYIVEGEKDVHTLEALGLCGTCNPGGAKSWLPAYNELFQGKNVVILPDQDKPGRMHGDSVAHNLQSVAVVKLVHVPAGKDVSDWVAAGGSRAALDALVEASGHWEPGPAGEERVSFETLLSMAVERVRAGEGRNIAGLWLFCQVRDAGYDRDEASLTVRPWVSAVTLATPKEDRYTLREAEATLRSAYKRDAREPWDTDGKESQADILLALAEDFEHFKSGPANEGYVRAAIGDHNEVWPAGNGKGVPSSKVREILTHRYLEKYDRAPSRDALNAVGDTVLAKCGAGPKVEVHVRFARTRDAIYLDMCDDKWRVIEITAAGWRVVDKPSVLFRRPSGARALPVPVAGGSLEALRPLLNCGDDTQWCLMIAWLAGAFLPEGAFSHLVLEGGQGSAKSTTARVLQSMLDPSDAGLTAPPKDETDATVSALHAGILAYDNLSGCRAEMSDLFCRFSTGQGYRSRTLYSNLDSTVASVRLPIILNGIDATVMRGDLLERCITLKLPAIDKAKRLTEQGIWSDFAGIHAGVLGALLNVVSCGLRNLPHTTLADAPRMSDFCTWITACEPALPWMTGKFLTAYTQTMESANRDLADNDPVASALLDWADKCVRPGTAMETTASDLLVRLNELTRESPKDLRHWPPDAQSLAYRLVRLAPVLKAQGIEVRRLGRTMKARSRWEIWRPGPQGVIPQFIEDASPVEDEAA